LILIAGKLLSECEQMLAGLSTQAHALIWFSRQLFPLGTAPS